MFCCIENEMEYEMFVSVVGDNNINLIVKKVSRFWCVYVFFFFFRC